jgi:IS4 transposase
LGAYAKNVLDRHGRWVSIPGSRKEHCVAERVGSMKKLGRVKVAFSRRRGEKGRLIVATNNLKYGAKNLIAHYRNRWPIEILFKMSKQHLGLGDYQFLRYTAVVRYLHLVMISHHLLTHLAINRLGEKALLNGCGVLRLPGVEQMQGILRNMLIEDRIKSLSDGTKYAGVARKLKTALITAE